MVLENFALTRLNTLALPAHAARYLEIRSTEQIEALTTDHSLRGMRRFVLGSGSNLVLTGDFDGLVLRALIPGRRLVGEDAGHWHISAGAGENWSDFVQWTLAHSWAGLENLSMIPGSVGAAPVQNIGAYGVEVADRILWLAAFDTITGKSMRFSRKDCCFSYRTSVFKQEGWHLDGRHIITEVTFGLPKRWLPQIAYADLSAELAARKKFAPSAQEIARSVIAVRRRKLPDPAVLPNAGSFFQNPIVYAKKAAELSAIYPEMPAHPQADGRVKLAAGWLIECAGWKGKRLGPVGFYEKQALVLVNYGGARAADVAALTRVAQSDVRKKFGVDLVPEPVFL
ncbi:MAG: UDP-N-acetylmuramate dehydrogenase [Candidatus Accumulibacter sp.]|jgi:UDP-N-acetylmuramate dehydrogenase|nr:UDP-N-acetylmuramate dehydrogenase [Accumulibacter sp.]